MIGVSFYLNDTLAEERILQAGKIGVKRAFTSLHIPEEAGNLAERAKQLLQLAKSNRIEVFADVSYLTPSHLGLESLFQLKDLGVTGLRLDDFFEPNLIVQLAKEFKIAINASILFKEDLEILLSEGLKAEQLIGWHNFYPRRETGLSMTFFKEQNELYKFYNIPIYAYVSGAGKKRGPLFEGLPTLEKHRNLDPFVAAIELFHEGVHEVYFGDPDYDSDLLIKIRKFTEDKTLKISADAGSSLQGIYQLRPDMARDVLRLKNTRTTNPVLPKNTGSRPAGTITMDNDLYGRYRGEIQITLCDLPADERVNVVGKVHEKDIPCLAFVQPSMKIELNC